MTANERVWTAIRLGKPDRVAVIPGLQSPAAAGLTGLSQAEVARDNNAALDAFFRIFEETGGWDNPFPTGATPTPMGMPRREIVRRAIEFDQPPRIPYSFLMPARSDFVELAALETEVKSRARRASGLHAGGTYRDEWGVLQEITGYSWDRIVDHPLKDLRDLAAYRALKI